MTSGQATDANNIKFDWINTYGENGFRKQFKSNAGKPWPAGLR